jgi:hypothetical protein
MDYIKKTAVTACVLKAGSAIGISLLGFGKAGIAAGSIAAGL